MDERTEQTVLKIVLGVLMVMVLGLGSMYVSAKLTDDAPQPVVVQRSNAAGFEPTQQAAEAITEQRAISLAEGIADGEAEEVELTEEGGKKVYIIEVEDDDEETTVWIDYLTGEILKTVVEEELSERQLARANPKITEEEAEAIALQEVDGRIGEVEAKKIDRKYYYEVEVQHGSKETDVLIDVITGKVVGTETEAADDDEDDDEREDHEELSEEEIKKIDGKITQEEAIKIAQSQLSGVVTDVEIERKYGIEVYAVEIYSSGEELDVIIDVKTGAVIAIED